MDITALLKSSSEISHNYYLVDSTSNPTVGSSSTVKVVNNYSTYYSTINNNQLVFDTFDLDIEKYPFARPIFHSDRGFQYTSKIFKCKLDEAGMIQSMSRVGKCIDNGPMEAFWGTLKSEMFYGIKFNDLESLKDRIEEYIFFYNNGRLQSNLKGMTPNQYRYHSYCNFIYF